MSVAWNHIRCISDHLKLGITDSLDICIMVVSHFSKSISPTTTFWELGLGFFGVRVILRGKLVLHAGVRFWRNDLWRGGVQPCMMYAYLTCGLSSVL